MKKITCRDECLDEEVDMSFDKFVEARDLAIGFDKKKDLFYFMEAETNDGERMFVIKESFNLVSLKDYHHIFEKMLKEVR